MFAVLINCNHQLSVIEVAEELQARVRYRYPKTPNSSAFWSYAACVALRDENLSLFH
jgi:hypothetical protein